MTRFADPPSSPAPKHVRELLAKATQPTLEALEMEGYTVKGWEQGYGEFGASASLTRSNEEAQREIDLSVGWVEGDPVATVMITRTPRKSVRDDLFLSRFVQQAMPGFDQDSLRIDSKKPIHEEIRGVFSIYTDLLQGPAAAIVRGDAWETGHFPDWTL